MWRHRCLTMLPQTSRCLGEAHAVGRLSLLCCVQLVGLGFPKLAMSFCAKNTQNLRMLC